MVVGMRDGGALLGVIPVEMERSGQTLIMLRE